MKVYLKPAEECKKIYADAKQIGTALNSGYECDENFSRGPFEVLIVIDLKKEGSSNYFGEIHKRNFSTGFVIDISKTPTEYKYRPNSWPIDKDCTISLIEVGLDKILKE